MNLKSLSKYTMVDTEKMHLIDECYPVRSALYSKMADECDDYVVLKECSFEEIRIEEKITKVCPKCGRKYPSFEYFCFDCSQRLKDIEKVNVRDIDVSHEFQFEGKNAFNDFTDIFTKENLARIDGFEFTKSDFSEIITNIKSTGLKNMDAAIKENSIELDSLDILEKIILFAKSFVDVDYKSYGQELGYYSFNRIYVDDRQLNALQITTILHELTHFLIKEMLTQMLCSLLDASKTKPLESIIAFILTYSDENCLIDEYAAHTVEGRFTLFGYQDYSSFLNIQNSIEKPDEEIEMLKTVGNTLANAVKEIIESFIDEDLLDSIKTQFRSDILDSPDYSQLRHENCILLTGEGLMTVLHCILVDGFATASQNIDKLIQINDMW